MKATNFAKSFHTYSDFAHLGKGPSVVESTRRTHAVIQERELSFRLYPHFHPYADDLMRRLVTSSMQRMLEADTEYVASGATLPGSVEVAVAADTMMRVKEAASCVLAETVNGTTAGGQAIELSAGIQVQLAADVTAKISDRLTMVDAWPTTPVVGEALPLTNDSAAVIRRDFQISPPAGTQVKMHDDSLATLSAEAKVLVLKGATVIVPNGTAVTPLKFKRRPVWYDDASFKMRYSPGTSLKEPFPVHELDFSMSGAYSCLQPGDVLPRADSC